MIEQLKQGFLEKLSRLPKPFYGLFLTWVIRLKRWPTLVIDEGSRVKVKEGQNEIQICERNRVTLYLAGIENRLKELARQYCLEKVKFREGDIFVDCGANIGELGVYLSRLECQVRYIAFEPGSEEKECCEKNNTDSEVIGKALWKDVRELRFFMKSDTADSSVFEPEGATEEVRVSAVSLDRYFEQESLDQVRLLKVEAEGAEPEVLEGAEKSLPAIDYVVVDVGPERGISKENTIAPVCNFLFQRGFQLVEATTGRSVFLFENTRKSR
ncbi:MAG: FkbM family methyltransferase [Verrucomicrobiota bacterium]